MKAPRITKVEVESFDWVMNKVSRNRAFQYDPAGKLKRSSSALRVYADNGAVGEYAGFDAGPSAVADLAKWYLGANPFDRDAFYQRWKASPAMAPLDIALWDMAGKVAGLPVHALVGIYRTEVAAYGSTIDGAVRGPLSTPESYGEFAEQCLEMGYKAFKMHPMAWPDIRDHIKAVSSIGAHVGGKMDMMVDSYCLYPTFSDALKVGRACDEAGFFWYEDPYAEGGTGTFPYERLREMIRTPLLQGEQSKTVEQRLDMALRKATDFVRADVKIHGLTGSFKLAHAAEVMGMDIEPHTSGPEELQFLGAVRNANYYEVVWVHPSIPDCNYSPPVYKNLNITRLDCIDKRGMVKIPQGPGLGVEYDWAYIAKHSTGKVVVEA